GAGAGAQRSSAGVNAGAARSSGIQGPSASHSAAGGSGAADANGAASVARRADEAAGGTEQSRGPRVMEQRVFVKITPQAENPELLARLKQLLQQHSGPVATVLFYEQQQKLLALSDAYRIKPSPSLFSEMEKMLGEGTVKIK
ncbi:DNA polymerase III subunit alpha, partial [Paenibacillus taichungensis]|nr:DNA polymerase III subunit alpha [Paenibacillus taichungensis]